MESLTYRKTTPEYFCFQTSFNLSISYISDTFQVNSRTEVFLENSCSWNLCSFFQLFYIVQNLCYFHQIKVSWDCLRNFRGTFKLANDMHPHHIRYAANNSVIIKQSKTQFYVIHLTKHWAASFWNTLQDQVNIDLTQESCHRTKDTITRHFLNNFRHRQKKSIKVQKSNDVMLSLQFLTNY